MSDKTYTATITLLTKDEEEKTITVRDVISWTVNGTYATQELKRADGGGFFLFTREKQCHISHIEIVASEG
jgi:hypothetical protein